VYKYRYRYDSGSTERTLQRINYHLCSYRGAFSKIGVIQSIKGYRYIGKYGVKHEAVMIKGDKGS
jgi:hypothetical protein